MSEAVEIDSAGRIIELPEYFLKAQIESLRAVESGKLESYIAGFAEAYGIRRAEA